MKYLSLLLPYFTAQFSQADLVAHWPLDTDANDMTGNGFHGAIVSGTINFGQTGANGNTGSAAAFPDNGHIEIPFDAALNPESFTVSLWVNATATGGVYRSPLTSRDDAIGSGTYGYIIYNNPDGNWDFWTGDGDPGWDGLAGDPVIVDTWTHLAITYDATSDTKTLWVNGVISATDNTPQSGPTQYAPNGTVETEALHLGSGSDTGEQYYFEGLIDDVGLWDEALNANVIQSIMLNGIASGLPDPALSVRPSVDLTLDGSMQVLEIPVKNGGQSQILNLSSATFNGDPNFSVTTLPGPIAPGAEDFVTITFDPSGGNGLFEGSLEITSDDSLNPIRTINLRGAIHDPMLVTSPTLALGQNTTGTITLTNDGASRVLEISRIDITGDSDHFSLTPIPTNIEAKGGTTGINVNFDPLGKEGDFSATVTINTNDPINPSFTVVVTANVPYRDALIAWWPLDLDGQGETTTFTDVTIPNGTSKLFYRVIRL
ncbi:LamG-like jellyroll fold domain-containing protein [Verrucomicrobiaceae bacterium 227]